jgi:ubiquitin carboxyl-terminal hydrolase L3
LYPSDKISHSRREEFAERCLPASPDANGGVFYLHQHSQFGNACGTIACVHSVLNNPDSISLSDGSPLQVFRDSNASLDADSLGWALADATSVHEASEESASGGQTETPDRDDHVDNHFITFVMHGGRLLELDGTQAGPIDHGSVDPSVFLPLVATIVQEQFMARDPTNLNFNLTALCKFD